MKNTEYFQQEGCLQRDSAEHEEYAGTQSVGVREGKEADSADLLERILSRENLNEVYKRVTDLIKKYLKSGVMVEGLLVKTEEGSPQGGPLSPLLANIYLNNFDQEMTRRGVKVIRYAGDIVILAKSKRAGE